MPHHDARLTELWAFLLMEELVRNGVTMFFAAPGSRSTPLVVAAARNGRAQVSMHVDERGTAFMALGWARMTGRPAAWITTSGTAVANGHPAVAEARLEGIPMILLTADRPPELRATSANQTIVQPGLFGRDVVWAFDMPPPSVDVPAEVVLTTVDHAVRRSAEGPVHLNCMFREPLHGAEPTTPDVPPHLQSWLGAGGPYTEVSVPGAAVPDVDALFTGALQSARRPLILLGRLPVAAPVGPIVSSMTGVPVLADVASQGRLGRKEGLPDCVTHFDAVLRDRDRWSSLAPDLVIQIGRPPVSKRWHQFMSDVRPARWIVADDSAERIDPVHAVTDRVVAPAGTCLAALATALGSTQAAPSDPSWSGMWRRLDEAATAWVHEELAHRFTEQAIVRAVLQALDPGAPLVLGSSNPVRHADTFAMADGPGVPVIVNRGASGIDGTIATAIGAAQAAGRRCTVVLGDLTLLHDLNSLLSARNVTVVVINNDGGGIFSYLPVAHVEDVFEPFFGTPHGRTFPAAAELFGMEYDRPETLPDVGLAVRRAHTATTGVLIEVRTQRGDNVAEQTRLLKDLQTHLRSQVPVPAP